MLRLCMYTYVSKCEYSNLCLYHIYNNSNCYKLENERSELWYGAHDLTLNAIHSQFAQQLSR